MEGGLENGQNGFLPCSMRDDDGCHLKGGPHVTGLVGGGRGVLLRGRRRPGLEASWTYFTTALVAIATIYMLLRCIRQLRSVHYLDPAPRALAEGGRPLSLPCPPGHGNPDSEAASGSGTRPNVVIKEESFSRSSTGAERDGSNKDRDFSLWRNGSVPPDVGLLVDGLFSRLEVSVCICNRVLTLVSDDVGFKVVSALAKLAAVELLVLATAPTQFEGRRREVCKSFVQLVLTAARKVKPEEVERQEELGALLILLEGVGGPMPFPLRITIQMYSSSLLSHLKLMKVANGYAQLSMKRLCSLATSNVQPGAGDDRPLRLLEALTKVRVSRVIRDRNIRKWLRIFHKRTGKWLLFTHAEYTDQKQRKGCPSLDEQVKELDDAAGQLGFTRFLPRASGVDPELRHDLLDNSEEEAALQNLLGDFLQHQHEGLGGQHGRESRVHRSLKLSEQETTEPLLTPGAYSHLLENLDGFKKVANGVLDLRGTLPIPQHQGLVKLVLSLGALELAISAMGPLEAEARRQMAVEALLQMTRGSTDAVSANITPSEVVEGIRMARRLLLEVRKPRSFLLNISQESYCKEMKTHLQAAQFVLQQIGQALERFKKESKAQQQEFSEAAVRRDLRVLESLLEKRSQQVLLSKFLRMFLVNCQSSINCWLLFSKDAYSKSMGNIVHPSTIQVLGELKQAVVNAGGVPGAAESSGESANQQSSTPSLPAETNRSLSQQMSQGGPNASGLAEALQEFTLRLEAPHAPPPIPGQQGRMFLPNPQLQSVMWASPQNVGHFGQESAQQMPSGFVTSPPPQHPHHLQLWQQQAHQGHLQGPRTTAFPNQLPPRGISPGSYSYVPSLGQQAVRGRGRSHPPWGRIQVASSAHHSNSSTEPQQQMSQKPTPSPQGRHGWSGHSSERGRGQKKQ